MDVFAVDTYGLASVCKLTRAFDELLFEAP